ncbi:hypothetical protein NEFER03_1093 [Nematocida sp. LUAm3]|nr:hypothetical protein NEFER03_1093 [Nematocida sp. LUAm3]KAI5175302.1 hypothetical protein NEFER02_1231 [Nematocida sp. LUAm2]KAI5177741.1 hypothetical protein NEFER01_0965 [Nematocida sp. LUAm1]
MDILARVKAFLLRRSANKVQRKEYSLVGASLLQQLLPIKEIASDLSTLTETYRKLVKEAQEKEKASVVDRVNTICQGIESIKLIKVKVDTEPVQKILLELLSIGEGLSFLLAHMLGERPSLVVDGAPVDLLSVFIRLLMHLPSGIALSLQMRYLGIRRQIVVEAQKRKRVVSPETARQVILEESSRFYSLFSEEKDSLKNDEIFDGFVYSISRVWIRALRGEEHNFFLLYLLLPKETKEELSLHRAIEISVGSNEFPELRECKEKLFRRQCNMIHDL